VHRAAPRHRRAPALVDLRLPPVLVPAFTAPLRERPPVELAALALALAALAAGSGARLVASWSRR
jgi:hypothetical protein